MTIISWGLLGIPKGIKALRILGLRLFLQKLGRQLYSKTHYFMLVHNLHMLPLSDEKVSVEPASPEDVAHFFDLMEKESVQSRYEMFIRKEFYEKGFHDCYIGRENSSHEICCISWLISTSEVHKAGFEEYYPELKENEVIGDNIYMLKKFRGKKLINSEGRQIGAIVRKKGYKRWLSYVQTNNIPSLRSCKSAGMLICKKIVRRKLLFRVYAKVIKQYDPPVPISIPDN